MELQENPLWDADRFFREGKKANIVVMNKN